MVYTKEEGYNFCQTFHTSIYFAKQECLIGVINNKTTTALSTTKFKGLVA